jgi:hypothetical protein
MKLKQRLTDIVAVAARDGLRKELMLIPLVALAALGISANPPPNNTQSIEGVVLNGTRGGIPVPGAEIILRTPDDLSPVAKTTADREGRFLFTNVPVQPGLVYLPGANHEGVHYPGPRLRLVPGGGLARVRITVFDALTTASPLVAEKHEMDVLVKTGVLEITETMSIGNPTSTTYVGSSPSEDWSRTLALSIPQAFERVTFAGEFYGKRFRLVNGCLETDLPWTPGKRELRFTYYVPVKEKRGTLERVLDLPSSLVRIRVRGEAADQVECNLKRVDGPDKDSALFESPEQLAAGYRISLQLGGLPVPWFLYGRWAALVLFATLVLVTVAARLFRRQRDSIREPILTSASR